MTLDLNLPGKDGLAFIKDLRAVPATQDLPIVVVSIRPPTDAKEIIGYSVNVVDWIQKPVDKDRLLNAIKRARSRRGGVPQILHVEDDSDLCVVVAGLVGDHAVATSAETFPRRRICWRTIGSIWCCWIWIYPIGPARNCYRCCRVSIARPRRRSSFFPPARFPGIWRTAFTKRW